MYDVNDREDLRVMSELVGRCRCGWKLPISVMAYPRGKPVSSETIVQLVYVSLVCPECGDGHQFYSSVDDMPADLADRFKKERA